MAQRAPFRGIRFVALAFILVAVVPAFVRFITDWWWFQEVGFESVFTTALTTRGVLFAAGALLSVLVLVGNVRIAQRAGGRTPVMWRVNPELPPVDVGAAIARLLYPFILVVAFIYALSAENQWMTWLQFANRTDFGTTDPVFGRDVGWYVFVLPAVAALIGSLRALVVLGLIAVVLMYLVRGQITFGPKRLNIARGAGTHIGSLVIAWFVLTAVTIWFVRMPELLYSTTGPLVGASYTDLNARFPALHVAAGAALLAAALVAYGVARAKVVWFTAIGAALYAVVSFIGGGVFPFLMQRFVVAPTELTRETPQLRSHIALTRRAWGIDSVETRDLTGSAELTLSEVRRNSATIENVRLWERDPLLQTFGQLQEIRTYYDFVSVDDDRYVIDGRQRQVMLSPRELNSESLPTRTFINQHLTFTHGMGLTLGPVNQVTSEGLPVLFVKDLPPASSIPIRITRPQIYYGELTNDHVFVNTRQREFDYPSGEANVYTRYNGKGGVRVGSAAKRALLATRFGALNILLSGDITGGSRILYNRNILTRAQTALPFVTFDEDPYMVVRNDGRLTWILDAYTRTERYPYAARLEDGTSYMRNSVKVAIDAYDGSIDAFIADPSDPLARTYSRIFRGVLKPLSAMPADLRAHIRYPEDIYRIQSSLYATYHMNEPANFYHREDQWQAPVVTDQSRAGRFMRHAVMRLPDEAEPEFIFMAPFTPRGKDNLAAWMVARNDGEHYGKLRVYRFPKQSLVYGPRQVMSRINQDTEIARELTLWDQRGSTVIRGELLVIPIERALIYVQPIYLRAEGGRIPELKRVVVAYQNQVVMAETLEAGLARVFGGTLPQADTAARADTAALVTTGTAPRTTQPAQATGGAASGVARSAREAYDAAISAQRAGNWAEYGRQIQRLGELLRVMEAQR